MTEARPMTTETEAQAAKTAIENADAWLGPPVIAITGPEGAGKSTLADMLCALRGFTPLKFADPLKNMLREFYRTLAVESSEIERRMEGDLKTAPCPHLGGKSPRDAMRSLGTEWGREMIWGEVWIDAWRRIATGLRDAGGPVVADDCRFPNEIEAVHAVGGVVIEIENPSVAYSGAHSSDAGLAQGDAVIANPPGAPEQMLDQIDRIVDGWRLARATAPEAEQDRRAFPHFHVADGEIFPICPRCGEVGTPEPAAPSPGSRHSMFNDRPRGRSECCGGPPAFRCADCPVIRGPLP